MPRSASPTRRSASPPASDKPKQWSQRKPKELSFYKRSARDYGQPQSRNGDFEAEESAKERAQRRERGEVPRRFGGTRDQGVRNTMGNVAAASVGGGSMGSLKRSGDPLDRMGVKGEKRERGGRDRDGGRRSKDDYGRERDYDRDRDRGRRDDRYKDEEERVYERRDDGDYRRASDKEKEVDRRHPDRQFDDKKDKDGKDKPSNAQQVSAVKVRPGRMIEVIANDRMGRKVRVKCLPTDTVGDLKKLIAAQTGTNASKIQLKKWYNIFKDHIMLQDYEINDGMSLEMY